MREIIGICVGIALGIWTASSLAMTITGQVVDSQARPVPGAEVVVCEKYRIGFFDDDARTISPVVKTDAEGRFALDVGVPSQRDAFLVARKAGFAHTWEWLNNTLSLRDRKHFPLVLEPPCVLSGAGGRCRGQTGGRGRSPGDPGGAMALQRRRIMGPPRPQEWFTVTTDAGPVPLRAVCRRCEHASRCGLRAKSRYVFHLHDSDFCGFEVGGRTSG